MTILIAYKDKDRTWLASDSLFSGEDFCEIMENSKIFSPNPRILVGCCGYARMIQLLKYSKVFDEYYPASLETVIKMIVPQIEELFKGRDLGNNWQIVICTSQNIFMIDDSFFVREYSEYLTVGSGYYLAEGSLFTTKHTDMPIIDKIDIALRASEEHSLSVRSPFDIRYIPE